MFYFIKNAKNYWQTSKIQVRVKCCERSEGARPLSASSSNSIGGEHNRPLSATMSDIVV